MKRWIALAVVVVLLMVGYAAAGPYLTINALRGAVQRQDAAALSRRVDFPAVRASLKAQLDDRLARRVGIDASASPLARLGLGLASGMIGGAVDTMVTPTGLAALMEGRKVWDRASGLPPPSTSESTPPPKPFAEATYRYESMSRFTVTATDEDGQPLVFVLTRRGLAWKLSDVVLPL